MSDYFDSEIVERTEFAVNGVLMGLCLIVALFVFRTARFYYYNWRITQRSDAYGFVDADELRELQSKQGELPQLPDTETVAKEAGAIVLLIIAYLLVPAILRWLEKNAGISESVWLALGALATLVFFAYSIRQSAPPEFEIPPEAKWGALASVGFIGLIFGVLWLII